MEKLSFSKFLKENKYLKLVNDVDIKNRYLSSSEISRPGVSLSGYFEYFSNERIEIFGLQEYTYLENHVSDENLKDFLKHKPPLIIFARNKFPCERFLKLANEFSIPVCVSDKHTSKLFTKVHDYLEYELAPETTAHGVMLNIFGKGVLIKGASGIGKSEVALELIKKGHILVADDMVVFKRIDTDTLLAQAPDILKSKMEIRGIGIVDIQKLYGVTSVLLKDKLDLIIELTDNQNNIDRIGNNYLFEEILEIKKKKIKIPILTGKSISNLIEVAVANYQLEEDFNYKASEEFTKDLNDLLLKKETDGNN